MSGSNQVLTEIHNGEKKEIGRHEAASSKAADLPRANLDEEVRWKLECLDLAMRCHVRIETAIENYDILSQLNKHNDA